MMLLSGGKLPAILHDLVARLMQTPPFAALFFCFAGEVEKLLGEFVAARQPAPTVPEAEKVVAHFRTEGIPRLLVARPSTRVTIANFLAQVFEHATTRFPPGRTSNLRGFRAFGESNPLLNALPDSGLRQPLPIPRRLTSCLCLPSACRPLPPRSSAFGRVWR